MRFVGTTLEKDLEHLRNVLNAPGVTRKNYIVPGVSAIQKSGSIDGVDTLFINSGVPIKVLWYNDTTYKILTKLYVSNQYTQNNKTLQSPFNYLQDSNYYLLNNETVLKAYIRNTQRDNGRPVDIV
jgi:hypothetical protein